MKIRIRFPNLFKRKSTKDESTALVSFPVLHEVHSLKEFQAKGHFVSAIRERDAAGNPTMQPREWEGKLVHALTLLETPGGSPHQTKNAKGEMQSTARALSDSREDAERILGDQIQQGFYAQLRALAIADFQADQARKVKDERDRMAAWMAHFHPNVLAEILGIGEAAVEEYKRSQASPVLKAAVDSMLKGAV